MRGIKAEIPPADEPPRDGVPAPPDWLSDDARSEWLRVLPMLLNERRTLSLSDLPIFTNYCVAVGQVAEANRILKEEGMTFKGPSGPKKHPALAILSDAMTQARQMATEMGLTPASRGRPGIKEGANDPAQPNLFGGTEL